jgi:hypothetical protein
MNLAEIHDAILTRPTVRHALRLNSGDSLDIPHADFARFPARSRGLGWFLVLRPDGGFVMVDASSVAALEVPAAARPA